MCVCVCVFDFVKGMVGEFKLNGVYIVWNVDVCCSAEEIKWKLI